MAESGGAVTWRYNLEKLLPGEKWKEATVWKQYFLEKIP